MRERLCWPRFTLINGICSLDSTFLRSLGVVSTLLLTDPSTAPSFCLSVPILLTGPPFGFLVKQGGTSQQIWSLLMKQEGTSQQKHIFWKQWDKKQPLTFITLSKNSSNVNTYALSDYSDLRNTTYPLTNYLQGNHLLALLATLIQDIFTCRFNHFMSANVWLYSPYATSFFLGWLLTEYCKINRCPNTTNHLSWWGFFSVFPHYFALVSEILEFYTLLVSAAYMVVTKTPTMSLKNGLYVYLYLSPSG